jgi:DUF1009 family protein
MIGTFVLGVLVHISRNRQDIRQSLPRLYVIIALTVKLLIRFSMQRLVFSESNGLVLIALPIEHKDTQVLTM